MSDLFTDLKSAVLTRLTGDAFFAGPPELAVILEDRLDLLSELSQRIGKLGACVVLSEPLITGQGNHSFDVTMVVEICEKPLINRSSSGFGKTGHEIAIACWQLLEGWAPSSEWAPFVVRRLEPMHVDHLPMIRELEIGTTVDLINE